MLGTAKLKDIVYFLAKLASDGLSRTLVGMSLTKETTREVFPDNAALAFTA
jgi:hypothetical protein